MLRRILNFITCRKCWMGTHWVEPGTVDIQFRLSPYTYSQKWR